MFRGAISVLTALLCALPLLLAPRSASAAPEWKKLHSKHTVTTHAAIQRVLKRDGVANAERLLKHRFLLRLEIRGAGGGGARHSEVVVRFRSQPGRVLAKAWSPGAPQRGRAQLGVWTECKTRKSAVGRTCPIKYNGSGFVDVTGAFTDRNILFVHDPAKKGRGNSIIWFAADRSQQYLWYYMVPHTAWPSFGHGRLRVSKYLVPVVQPPARLPGDPPDPGSPGVRPLPRPLPRPAPPALPPITKRRKVSQWTTSSALHRATSKSALTSLMRQDGVTYPGYLLSHRFLLRVALTEAGGGSRSRTELVLRLLSRPSKALGKAWADRGDLRRAQIGATDRCRALRAGQGGPEGHTCPVHFNALGWRNLVSAFTSKNVRIISDPNNNNQGNVVLWLAFDSSQSGLTHKFVHRDSLPTFGPGKLSLGFYAVSDGEPGLQPVPGPTAPTTPGWTALGTTHRPASRALLRRRMRRDGVASPGYLLRYKYLVRLSLSGAGGGQGRRSEVVVKMGDRPRAALGMAWTDHRRRWGAQLGGLSSCKPVPRANNPYGGGYGVRRRWHACPLQYNGLGWRNLITGFSEKKVMLVTAPFTRGRGNQLLWLAFDNPQSALAYRAVANDPSHHSSMGALHAELFSVGATSAPTAPGSLAWTPETGTHTQVHKNTLYWTIRRSGFNNPWYVLSHRYVLQVQLTTRGQRADTVLRFSGPPAKAVGNGIAAMSNRSAVQAGTLAGCTARAGQPAHCPLHFGNLGWRNLITGLTTRTLLFVNIPLDAQREATTTLWLSFDNPQSTVEVRHLQTGGGQATVTIKRYRW